MAGLTGVTRKPTTTTSNAPGPRPTPIRRRRPLLAGAAVLLTVLVWLVVSSGLERASARTQVWALGSDVVRGQTVDASQLVPAEVATSSAAGLVEVTDARSSELAGAVWAADLPTGTLVSSALVLDTLPVADGQALVGLALPPGGWPTPSLRAGDAVTVIGTADGRSEVLVERATVDAMTLLGDATGATRLVTVAVPDGAAAEVAAAAAAGQVALAVIP